MAKLEIKEVLKALDQSDKAFYNNLTDEEKKSITAEIILRWMSTVGVNNIDFAEARRQGRKKGDKKGAWPSVIADNELTDYFILMANEIANLNFGGWLLSKHPELQWKLLCILGTDVKQPQEHIWLSQSKKSDTPKLDEMLQAKFPLANHDEIKMLKNMSTVDDFEYLAQCMGYTDEEIKSVLKECEKLKK